MLPFLLLFAAGPLYLDTECPHSDEPSYFAHPTDCSLYYECIQGQKYEGSCPDGLFWNDQEKFCDIAENVNCPSSNDPSCPSKETSYIVYPGDCKKYYLCTNGQKEERSCPENMFFSPETNTCGYEDEVDCSYTPTSTQSTASTASTTHAPTTITTAATTTTASSNDCPSKETSYIVYPGDCKKYYLCTNGQKEERSCPENMFFSPETNTCGYEDEVDCSYTPTSTQSTASTASTTHAPTTITTAATTTTDPSPIDPICPSTQGTSYVVYPDDCTKYYKCTDGHSTLLNCPENMFFNPSNNQCDYVDNVSCSLTTKSSSSTSTSTTTSVSTTSAPTTNTPGSSSTTDPMCPSTHGTSYVAYPDDCSKYYKCTDGYSTLLKCPENMVFNPKTKSCDYSDNVSCDSTHGPTSGTTTTTTSPSTTPTTAAPTTTFNPSRICQDKPDGTFIADPSDCTKYYECVYGDAKSFSCPYDTMWDESVTACVKANDECK